LVSAQDLGQAQGEEVVDEDKAVERIALVRTQTEASGVAHQSNVSTNDGVNYNVISCIFIVLKEQGHLWKCFILLGIATIVGGRRTIQRLRGTLLTMLQVHLILLKPYCSLGSFKRSSCHPTKGSIRVTFTP
jgi:hypothetical protein